VIGDQGHHVIGVGWGVFAGNALGLALLGLALRLDARCFFARRPLLLFSGPALGCDPLFFQALGFGRSGFLLLADGFLLDAQLGGLAQSARDLAYRLYSICERRGWSQEAQVYNSLVAAWPTLKELEKAREAQRSLESFSSEKA